METEFRQSGIFPPSGMHRGCIFVKNSREKFHGMCYLILSGLAQEVSMGLDPSFAHAALQCQT